MSFSSDPKFVAAFTRIAVFFLVRANLLTEDQAKFEIQLIKDRIGIEAFVAAAGKCLKFDNEAYIMMARVGATHKLNRKQRVAISLTLSNAINHASVEAGYY